MRWGRLLAVAAIGLALLLAVTFLPQRLIESDTDTEPPARSGGAAKSERSGGDAKSERGGGAAKSERGGGDATSERGGEEQEGAGESSHQESVKTAHCPAGVPDCAETEGRVLYVEAVDPDGDGDAHFVVLDGQSISLPGLTAIDVRKGLRPDPLPGPGDLVSAAGPVQTGSFGQSQIHALEFNVAG